MPVCGARTFVPQKLWVIHMSRTLIKCGETYGVIRVLSIVQQRPKKYSCQCEKCGSLFVDNGQTILRYSNVGCPDCRRKAAERVHIVEAEKYVGRTFGELTVTEVIGIREYSGSRKVFVKCLCACGNSAELPLSNVKCGQIKTCGHNRSEQLKKGMDICKNAHVGGTLITAIDGRRKRNKNNTTGHNGVCYISNLGKYRAYIVFRGKQYNLGLFNDINAAVAARKAAEENIYGNFLEWFMEEYPERCEQILKGKTAGQEENNND